MDRKEAPATNPRPNDEGAADLLPEGKPVMNPTVPTLTPMARAFLEGTASCIEKGDKIDLDMWAPELAAAIRQALAVIDEGGK